VVTFEMKNQYFSKVMQFCISNSDKEKEKPFVVSFHLTVY
jgi:hypothetical protein